MAKKTIDESPAAILGRLGGQANTAKQNAARRKNAKLAGRPRRVCKLCHQPVLGGHVDRALDATCGAHGWVWQQGAPGKSNPVVATSDRKALITVRDTLDQVADAGEAIKAIRTAMRRAGLR
jgi:hypothetical protein